MWHRSRSSSRPARAIRGCTSDNTGPATYSWARSSAAFTAHASFSTRTVIRRTPSIGSFSAHGGNRDYACSPRRADSRSAMEGDSDGGSVALDSEVRVLSSGLSELWELCELERWSREHELRACLPSLELQTELESKRQLSSPPREQRTSRSFSLA